MTNNKLEKLFITYLSSIDREYAVKIDGAIIFTAHDFHINPKMNTLYVKDYGIFNYGVQSFETIKKQKPDWAAITKTPDGFSFFVGFGNPYVPENLDILPTCDGVIVATPISIVKKRLKNEQTNG